ncbi:MAG: ABC transporter permease [Chloroflexi bacterium]|nr:ABC transporter permease [Chloroflexota bacterium]
MQRYLARRLLLFIPTLVLVSLLVFGILRMIPGDVALLIAGVEEGIADPKYLEQIRQSLGLRDPLYVQYLRWMGGLVSLNAGDSFWTQEPVFQDIARRLPISLELAFLTMLIATVIAVPAGIISAIRQDSWLDYIARVVAIGGLSIPTFWLANIVLLVLARVLNWLPPLEYSPPWKNPVENLQHLFFPAAVMGYYQAAALARMLRSTMLEVLREDYVRTAWAKGLLERVVVARHVLKNALLPVVTILGMQLAFLVGSMVIVETIFVVPGVGQGLVQSITVRDYPSLQTLIVLFGVLTLIANLAVDALYAWLDPRIRYD